MFVCMYLHNSHNIKKSEVYQDFYTYILFLFHFDNKYGLLLSFYHNLLRFIFYSVGI